MDHRIRIGDPGVDAPPPRRRDATAAAGVILDGGWWVVDRGLGPRYDLPATIHQPIHMHIVLVQVKVRAEMLGDFARVALENARESVLKDPGCIRFDISQVHDDPTRWVFYEVYVDRAAHAAHRESAHFKAYSQVADRAIVEKAVAWCVDRQFTGQVGG
jgi:autoinducer 2-degrading protein